MLSWQLTSLWFSFWLVAYEKAFKRKHYAIVNEVMASKHKQRTYARNRAFSRKGREKIFESDGLYLLKLIGYILLGSFWIKLGTPVQIGGLSIGAFPVGLAIGLVLVWKFEQYQSGIISLFAPSGIVI